MAHPQMPLVFGNGRRVGAGCRTASVGRRLANLVPLCNCLDAAAWRGQAVGALQKLLNLLVGERMSIITAKPQTTRHRIIGIMTGDDFQIVFSDTPGFVRKPSYKMHDAMNSFVKESFDDADVMLFVTEPSEAFDAEDPIIKRLQNVKYPKFLVLNKIDSAAPSVFDAYEAELRKLVDFQQVIRISALHKTNMETFMDTIKSNLPEGPAYYPQDQLTDRPERFFVAEIIREKILLNYRDEIPYACEVIIESFKETELGSTSQVLAQRWSTSDEGLIEQPNPSGGKGTYVNLQGRFENGMVATVDANGAIKAPCAQGLNTDANLPASGK